MRDHVGPLCCSPLSRACRWARDSPDLGQEVSSDLRSPGRRSGWLFLVLEKAWLGFPPVPGKRSALDRCQCGVRPPEISGGLAAGGNHNFSLHVARARITDSVTGY